MTNEDFANIIRLARRSPLANMDEAETAAALLQRFAAFILEYKPPTPKKRVNGHDGDAEKNKQSGALNS